MSLVLQSTGGGQITIQEPATASNFTATMPAATGTVMVSGNQPAFSAYSNVGQSIPNATFTKILFQVEEFDTANAFDSTTNYRFTPQTAGYYQVSGSIFMQVSGQLCTVYKNGVEFKRGVQASGATLTVSNISCLVYLNGSTDYIELYVYQSSGSTQTLASGQSLTYFQASMVRAD